MSSYFACHSINVKSRLSLFEPKAYITADFVRPTSETKG